MSRYCEYNFDYVLRVDRGRFGVGVSARQVVASRLRASAETQIPGREDPGNNEEGRREGAPGSFVMKLTAPACGGLSSAA